MACRFADGWLSRIGVDCATIAVYWLRCQMVLSLLRSKSHAKVIVRQVQGTSGSTVIKDANLMKSAVLCVKSFERPFACMDATMLAS